MLFPFYEYDECCCSGLLHTHTTHTYSHISLRRVLSAGGEWSTSNADSSLTKPRAKRQKSRPVRRSTLQQLQQPPAKPLSEPLLCCAATLLHCCELAKEGSLPCPT